jgi:hypothetical protein
VNTRVVYYRRHLRRNTVRPRLADIIRCRKKDLGYREDYNHPQGDMEAWIDLNSP